MARKYDVTPKVAVDGVNTLGESPVWSVSEQALYWVDILAPAIHRWHLGGGARSSWAMPATVGSIGLMNRGGIVAALRTGFHRFDPAAGSSSFIAHPEPDRPTNRLNDGKCGPDGSFWAGTMDDRTEKEPVASLYRLSTDGRCERMATGLKVSNGLAWSPNGRTLYLSDSRAATIWRYPHEPGTGKLGQREVFVAMQPEWGRPDGGAVDAEGCYWGCGAAAGRVNRFSPAGELLGWIELPVSHPTMPCFGGPDLRTLYVTSARENFSPAQISATPLAGSLFEIKLDIAGVPVGTYAG